MELRFREDDEGGNTLIGYAAVFNSLSENLGGFREMILPGAFTDTLQSGKDVIALYDHDTSKPLARTSNGTLTLTEDDTGLLAEMKLPNTSYVADLKENVRSGLIKGMSFGFFINKASWKEKVQQLSSVELLEVSITALPAYTSSSVELRNQTGMDMRKRQIWLIENEG